MSAVAVIGERFMVRVNFSGYLLAVAIIEVYRAVRGIFLLCLLAVEIERVDFL